jgi:hypothetical protein
MIAHETRPIVRRCDIHRRIWVGFSRFDASGLWASFSANDAIQR